jgi:tRNA threonylcarbamoyl adenosine modification protein YjeE
MINAASEEETIQAGRDLAPRLSGVVLLTGDLGAGKTTLVRGIVSAIEGAHPEEVGSPTFTLIHTERAFSTSTFTAWKRCGKSRAWVSTRSSTTPASC